MKKYALLKDPGHNRVYYEASKQVSINELKFALDSLGFVKVEPEVVLMGGLYYYTFEVASPLEEKGIKVISNLSFVFALFEIVEEGLFLPVTKTCNSGVNDKISSVLRYPGKTNEQFTKMMINVAAMASDFDSTETLNLLDPISGKGTTLFEGAVLGYNTYGVELDTKSYEMTFQCFSRFLKEERLKHQQSKEKLYGKKIPKAVMAQTIDYGLSKIAFKEKLGPTVLRVVNGNTCATDKYYKGQQFHLIVGDLPYGIAHGNHGDGKSKGKSLTRNPLELMEKALPAYYKVLKKGGCLVLAWNSFVFSKVAFEDLLKQQGFETISLGEGYSFEHRVDQSIKRDIVIAKKA